MENYLKVLSARLTRLEREVASIRQGLAELGRSGADLQAGAEEAPWKFRADKNLHRSLMKDLFIELGIEGQPIVTEKLQEGMEKVGLEKDELSRDLIKAREQ